MFCCCVRTSRGHGLTRGGNEEKSGRRRWRAYTRHLWPFSRRNTENSPPDPPEEGMVAAVTGGRHQSGEPGPSTRSHRMPRIPKALRHGGKKAPGPQEEPEKEEPTPISTGQGQGEPSTQGSGESPVVETGHPPGNPGHSSVQNIPETCKFQGLGLKNKPSMAEGEQAALPPEAMRGAGEQQESRAKEPGPNVKLEREEPSLASAVQGQGEPSTQGSGESAVVECSQPPGDPGHSSDHQDIPETCGSLGQRRKKTPSMVEEEQAALPPEAMRGAGEQQESRAKAPGPNATLEREETSLVITGQGLGEPPTQGSVEFVVVECGHPPGDQGPSSEHQDVHETWKSPCQSQRKKPSMAEGEQSALPPDALRGAKEQGESRAKVPGPNEMPAREEPSLVSTGQGQGEPPTQGSGESMVVECGHPPGDPGPSSNHRDVPETSKSRGRRRRKKPSVAKGEKVALPPEAPRGAKEQRESGVKVPGPWEKPEKEEPSLVTADQGQGEPPTQGLGESIVVERGHPPGDPGPSSNHQDVPETCKSRGRPRRKKPSVAMGEQAAPPSEALRGAKEQGESEAKAPGPRKKPEREEPSLISPHQGQGEPPTQGSGESMVVECGHPPEDPGPSSNHQDVPETCKSRGRRRRKKPSVAKGEQAALPPEAPRGAKEQGESGVKAPGPWEKPEKEEPSLVITDQGQGEPPTQGSGESIVVERGHPPGDPGPSSDHQDVPETCKSRGRRRRKKPSVAEGEQAALPPEAMSRAKKRRESGAKAPGPREKPKREEPSLVIADQGQGEPPTQGSGESIVVECGHPPGDPGPSSNHQDVPETCKSRGRRRRKKPSVAKGEQAALPPEASRGAKEQGESGVKVPGPWEKPKKEEPSLVIADQGQGEPPTQGSGESMVVECGHPPGDPGPSSDHQDVPETCKSRGRPRRKKPSVAKGEQAALPPEAPRGAKEQGESEAKAPGPRKKPEREEPSLISPHQGQGEPPTQGSGESIVVECSHPPGDLGPSSDHQDVPGTESRGRSQRKKPSVAEGEQAALPPEAMSRAKKRQESGAKAPGPREKPKREEPSLVIADQGQGEPPTQGSGESIVVERGHPPGDPGPSSNHQDVPETCKSRGRRRRKKPSVAKGEQAALPPEASRGAKEQGESEAKAPGPSATPEGEEPSLVNAGEGQGEPPTQGSGESTVVECGHPPEDPRPSSYHQAVPETWKSRGRQRKKKPSVAEGEHAALPPEAM